MIVNREIIQGMKTLISKYPILALTGPRQSGKTTLLKTLFPDYQYISLENPDNLNFAQSDPNGFLTTYSNRIIFDEVQRIPELFSYLQTKVDESGLMGQFILSGSQNFHLMQSITQSLAGRVALFKLLPFDFQELKAASLLSNNCFEVMVKGQYPAIYDRDIPSKTFYSNYIQTYIERDVTELLAIKDTQLFRKFLGLCASRAAQLLNLNSLANECGITQPTAKAWISLLESSYIIFLLQPYHENFSKRLVKSPKLYFYDSGLLCHLLKISDASQILSHPIKGNLFENAMVAEYTKRCYHKNQLQDLWFWRDAAGHEVDLLTQDIDSINLMEIKATQTILSNLFKGLNYFEQRAKNIKITKSLIYAGNESQVRTDVKIISWRDFGE